MRTNFELLDAYLRGQKETQILVSHLFSGVSPEKVQNYESDLGWKLSDEIKGFFQTHNGLILRWISKEAKGFDPEMHSTEEDVAAVWTAVLEVDDYNPQVCSGQSLISGFEALFSLDQKGLKQEEDPMEFRFAHEETFWEDDSWKEPHSFRGIDYANKGDFIQRLRFLDIFSRDEVAMMLLEPSNPDPPVFHMLSGSTEPDEDLCIPLSTYLTLVPYTLGKPMMHEDMFRNPGEFLVRNKIFFDE